MQTYKTAPPLELIEQQRSHYDFLTPLQVIEAKNMGIKGMTTNDTQRDLLKILRVREKNAIEQKRTTSKFVRNLRKKHGSKRAWLILDKAFKQYGHL
jgi:hypothetical protein